MIDSEEHVMTGWEPDAPASDTLLRGAVLSLADRIVRYGERHGRPLVDDGLVAAAFMAERGAFANMAVVCRPPDDWDAVRASVDGVVPAGTPLVLMSPWPTPDLSRHGLALIGHPPFMILPTGGAPERLPDGIDVTEVDDAAGIDTFDRVLIEGYPMPDIDRGYFTEALLGGRSHFFIGAVDGEPVAVAASHVSHGVHQVEFVATLAPHRGKGYGGAVTWAASSVDPSLPAVLIASDDGRPVYERLGYLSITRWTLWMRP